uniref:Xylanolytic transcriptional activator regulatory domain-containing protein n=1 Tax=Kwoniella bestiolae CBS 10118 TaxID=1296100 RepID=A0A1B9FX58_9TREE|nr:hypothetical protein I302_07695 [Kwoniella bestiolae CBS 10118]OCF23341.1 hypothetical protein I302_07695 [Kwoniella bestiolae CBS 10118]
MAPKESVTLLLQASWQLADVISMEANGRRGGGHSFEPRAEIGTTGHGASHTHSSSNPSFRAVRNFEQFDVDDAGDTQRRQSAQGFWSSAGRSCLRWCRCDAALPSRSSSSVAARHCTQCQNLKIECTFNYQAKRRGPVPGFLRSQRAKGNIKTPQHSAVMTSPIAASQHISSTQPLHPSYLTTAKSDPSIVPTPTSSSSSYALIAPSVLNPSVLTLTSSSSTSFGPPIPNPLDAVLPRSLRFEIISLFFRCVWPLLPVPHRITFMEDMRSKREERIGQEEWVAMVFSLLAFTLVQIPHHMVSISKNEIRDLVEVLSRKVKLSLMEDYHAVSLERLITVYCIGTVFNNLGRHIQSRALHGSNVVHCLQLGLNEESTYASMDPIAAEMHRRLFWAVYCSDRSAACSENGNLLFNEDEINVALPKDLDDEFITRYGYQEPPAGHASLMRGFVYSCRLFSLGGNMLSKRMHDRSRPPNGNGLRGRINELDELLQNIEDLLVDCQPEMRLSFTDMGSMVTEIEGGFADALPDMLEQLIPASLADSTPFLVHSAHVRVTQQLFRFLTLQYREDLSRILYHEQLRNTSIRPVLIPTSPKSEEHNKRKVLEDLLQILHGIPLEIHGMRNRWHREYGAS